MSLVASRLSLIHRCGIERASNAGEADGWGTAEPPEWETHLEDQMCRGWETTGRQAVNADTFVVIEDRRLIVPLGTDVRETDRVTAVTHRGEQILEGPMRIDAVLARRDRIELVLTRIK